MPVPSARGPDAAAIGDPALQILGPVAVRDAAGAEVSLGGPRPRRLLTGLALCAGEAVTADRLADVIWGDRPPCSARANLHTYLWSLRRCLDAAGCQVTIDASPGGYVLRAGSGVLDWNVFRDLAAAAAGIARSDPDTAAALLRNALYLWRGAAAADLDGGPPWLAARIAAMNEARIVALEQRIEADLATGRHRDLVPELAELTATDPLREQFRAYQMTALYRSGRQADSLAAYSQLREVLVAELGIDPSPPLRALHRAILRNDPLVGWPPVPAAGAVSRDSLGQRLSATASSGSGPPANPSPPDQAASRPVAPAFRPPRETTLGHRVAVAESRLFQGRRAELSRMLGLLAAPWLLPRVVQVHGPAGIGKTALAYALARECEMRGWPAVILDSRDFSHDSTGLSEAIAARSAELWSPGCGRPLLLVLDTLEEMRDIEHRLWEMILPGLKGPVLVLLAGRRPKPVLARPGAWLGLVDDVELTGLTDAESRRLIQLLGVRDPEVIGEVLGFARGNPLYLTVAAQHARAAGTRSLSPFGLVACSLIGRMTSEIANPGVRRLMEAASLVRTFNQELLAAMLNGDVSADFEALCGLSVVRAVPAGMRLHDVVRDAVAADLRRRTPQACQDMRRRAYAYLARRAQDAADTGPYIQELLHLVADSSARARFYAPADHPDVHIRPACSDDLPRLSELCESGITRFGYPPAERAKQLHADFPVARKHFAVALNDAGAITGFAYTVRLNCETWRTAAETRAAFFDALPDTELAVIQATPADARQACLVAGATHLPGYDHVSTALKEALFPEALDRRALASDYVAYHLLTPDCLELPEIIAAGHSRRTTNIKLAGCRTDEWLLRFGNGGLIGWIGEVLGIKAAEPGTPGDPDSVPSGHWRARCRSAVPVRCGEPIPSRAIATITRRMSTTPKKRPR
jgi:DNA-binding SARP family transcriptional activator